MTPDDYTELMNSPPPLFIYTVTPDEVDTSTNTDNPVTLTIGVYNPKQNGFVACSEIQFGISIGDKLENQLTADWQDVHAQSNQSDWIIPKQPYTSSPLIFKATPVAPTTGLNAGQSISFELTGINVNDVEGDAPIQISEVTAQQTAKTQANINKTSPNLEINYFNAEPTTILPGEQATLSWQTTGASRVTIDQLDEQTCSPPLPIPDPLPLTGSVQVCPQETTTYTLTAYDAGGGYREMPATVTVASVQIPSFTANPDTVDYATPTSTLEWKVLNATKLTLDPGGIDVTGKDSFPITPQIDSHDITSLPYTLTAEGPGGPVSSSATLFVNQPAITSFTATPAEVVHGQPVTLAWATEYAGSCLIDQSVGQVEPASGGSVEVSPQETTTYTLSAEGLGIADTRTATATVLPTGWQQATLPMHVADVAFDFQGKIWLIHTGDGFPVSVSTSSDGLNWTEVTNTLPLEARDFCAGAVFDDGSGEKMWIMGGGRMDSNLNWQALNDVWSSADGINWTQAQTSNIWSGRCGHACVVFQGKMWVLGGNVGGLETPASDNVWSTTDGVHWTQETAAPWGPRAFSGATVFTPSQPANINQLWLCGGSRGFNSALDDAWYTNDCVTWTQAPQPPWSARLCPNLLPQFNDKLWLIGGFQNDDDDSNSFPDMWAMDASMNWTSAGTVSDDYALLSGPVTFVLNRRIWLAGQTNGVLTSRYQYYNP